MLRELLQTQFMKDLKKINYEKSLFVYIKGTEKQPIFKSCKDTERIGDVQGVGIGDIEQVVNNCRILDTNKVILVHNHPKMPIKKELGFFCKLFKYFETANVCPSKADITTTGKYLYQLKSYGINLIDHIIISEDGYYSFKNNKIL